MRTIGIASGVQGDDLMTEDVVSCGDGGGDCDGPAIVVGDELVARPLTRRRGIVDETTLVDLEELQGCLVNRLALAIAVGKVVEHGTVVGRRPGAPLEGDLVTGRDLGGHTCVGGTLVADDIGVAVAGWWDETIILVLRGGPADDGGRWALVLVGRVVAWVVLAGNDDAVNDAVGEGGAGEDAHEGELLHCGHDDWILQTLGRG